MKVISRPEVILTIIFTVISLWLFNSHGVKNVNDSHRYLDYARNLEGGFYFEEHNFWYVGYAIFILLVRQIYDSELAIIIAQNLVSLIAVIALYKTSISLFKNRLTAMITALAYLFFLEIPTWNFYLLCESIYCSFVCISLYFLARIYTKQVDYKTYFLAIVIVLFTSLIKPTGVALIGAILVLILFNSKNYINNRTLNRLLVLGSVLIFVLLLNRMLATYLIIENYQIGEIVYAVSTLSYKPEYDFLLITPPENLYIPPQQQSPLLRIMSFMVHHPIYWMKLFFLKTFYFLFHVRPFWSLGHNLFSILFLVPIYGFFIVGMFNKVLKKDLTIFLFAYVLLHLLSISITSVDWDGRFLMPVLPAIFLQAASVMANTKLGQQLLTRLPR